MIPQIWLQNLAAYSVQVAVLIVAGTTLVYLFRLKTPAVLLAFWQLLFLICLLLPAFQSWRPVLQAIPVTPQKVIPGSSVLILPAPAIALPAPGSAAVPSRSVPFPTYAAIAWIIGIGAGLRLLWLVLGLLRLHHYRNKSRLLSALPESIRDMQWRVGVSPEIFLSTEIDTPVTFGLQQPAVIFPQFFTAMGENLQRPIACHELLHVQRRDWLFIVIEEVLRSLFWFHPAIWWALGRIHLSREQVVDHEVLRVTGERGPYLESLLHIASLRGRPASVPAPLLLRERHLVQRVALMVKESTMTRSRLIFSLAAITAFLFLTGAFAAAWFPLTAQPAVTPVQAQPNSQGAPPSGNQIMFAYDNASLPEFIKQIANVLGLSPIQIDPDVKGAVTLYTSTPVTREELRRLFDQVLLNNHAELVQSGGIYRVVSRPAPVKIAPAVTPKRQAAKREPLRVGSEVQRSKLIYRVEPVYPELARRARVEAIVMLDVLINENGDVTRIQYLRGHPLLEQAAKDAVMQWRYSPTHLNGEAVPVITTVSIPFHIQPAPATPVPATSVVPAQAANAAAQPARVEPVRVGGNVQNAKLIYKVEPVYPELARRARVEAIVFLEVSVNEQGEVTNVSVIRGHPLLDEAARTAVMQWRYSPTYLNGAAVPVIATQTVTFKMPDANTDIRAVIDADGSLKDLEGRAIPYEQMRARPVTIQAPTGSPVPKDTIERTLRSLESQGIRNYRLAAPAYRYRDGRLYYSLTFNTTSNNAS